MKLKTVTSLVLASLSIQAYAETDIETITVTAIRAEQNRTESIPNIHVITRSDIDLIQPQSTLDLLKATAGIDMSIQGGKGQQSNVFLRGTNANHTLVLLNGLRIGSATLGTTDLQQIAPNQIERIEIIKGPRAAIWGSDAIGGVINIITRMASEPGLAVSGRTGSDEFRQLATMATLAHGNGASSLSVSKESLAGFDVLNNVEPDDDGFEQTAWTLMGKQIANEQIELQWLAQTNKGWAEYDSPFFGNNKTSFDHYLWNIQGSYVSRSDALTNRFSVHLGQSVDRAEDYQSSAGLPDNYMFATEYETDRNQLSVINNTRWQQSLVTFGIDYIDESIDSSTLYDQRQRDIAAVFVHGQQQFGLADIELATRYHKVDGLDSELTYSLGTKYQLNQQVELMASYGTGFKTPTFNDLYYPSDPYSSGNPDLTAERSKSFELALMYRGQFIDVDLNVFQTDVTDLIEWLPDVSDNFRYKPENIAEVNIEGAELVLTYRNNWAKQNVNLSYISSEDSESQQQLTRRAKQQASYAISAELGLAELYLEYLYKGKRYDVDWLTGRQALASYSLLNIGLTYPINEHVRVTAKLDNALDEQYITALNYNTSGRTWYLGFELNL